MVVLTSTMAERGMLTLGFEDWSEHYKQTQNKINIYRIYINPFYSEANHKNLDNLICINPCYKFNLNKKNLSC